jgi:hypothetical protein
MNSYLQIQALGQFPIVPISDAEFQRIKAARNTLANGLAIEQIYDLLVGNYLEFEKELLSRAADAMVKLETEYKDVYEVQLAFNRRLANFLGSAKMYIDQLPQELLSDNAFPGISTSAVKEVFSSQYDASAEYRFMEALRNHVQHQGLPVHWVQFNHAAEGSGDLQRTTVSIEIVFRKGELRRKDKFKASVLSEIGDLVDIKMTTRVYMQCLSRAHGMLRVAIHDALDEARTVYQQSIDTYRDANPGEYIGLNAFSHKNEFGQERIPIFLEWDDVRQKLDTTNRILLGLASTYVTSRQAEWLE